MIQAKEPPYGNYSFVELSNNCLDPAAQIRFLDNGGMFNLKIQACFFPISRNGFGSSFGLTNFYFIPSIIWICYNNNNITQTPWGGLFWSSSTIVGTIYFAGCALPNTSKQLVEKHGVDPYIQMTTDCNDRDDKRFNFGKFL